MPDHTPHYLDSVPITVGCSQCSRLMEEVHELRRRLRKVEQQHGLDACEHGVMTGDWCPDCNREYKSAAEQFEKENS